MSQLGKFNGKHIDLPRSTQDRRKVIENTYKQAKPGLIIKPGRTPTAGWLDQFTAQRMGVNLCNVCARIYGGPLTHPKYSYRPDPLGLKLGDCDGCGGTGQPETLYPYYPAEKYQALRIKPNPNHIKRGVT